MPPSTNGAYFNTKFGRAKTGKAKEWHQKAAFLAKQQCASHDQLLPYPPRYRISLGLYFKDMRVCDIANREKLAIDLLVDLQIIKDDSLIDELVIRRMGMDKSNPRVEITIESLNPQLP